MQMLAVYLFMESTHQFKLTVCSNYSIMTYICTVCDTYIELLLKCLFLEIMNELACNGSCMDIKDAIYA